MILYIFSCLLSSPRPARAPRAHHHQHPAPRREGAPGSDHHPRPRHQAARTRPARAHTHNNAVRGWLLAAARALPRLAARLLRGACAGAGCWWSSWLWGVRGGGGALPPPLRGGGQPRGAPLLLPAAPAASKINEWYSTVVRDLCFVMLIISIVLLGCLASSFFVRQLPPIAWWWWLAKIFNLRSFQLVRSWAGTPAASTTVATVQLYRSGTVQYCSYCTGTVAVNHTYYSD